MKARSLDSNRGPLALDISSTSSANTNECKCEWKRAEMEMKIKQSESRVRTTTQKEELSQRTRSAFNIFRQQTNRFTNFARCKLVIIGSATLCRRNEMRQICRKRENGMALFAFTKFGIELKRIRKRCASFLIGIFSATKESLLDRAR